MKTRNNCVKLNGIFLIAIVLLFVVISIKIVYVAVSPTVDGIDLKALALSNRSAEKKVRATRGTIYDIAGEILAQDVRSYTVIAYLEESRTSDITKPRHVVDKVGTAQALSPLIGMTPEYIKNLLDYDAYQVELGPGGRGITELKKQQIEALELPGISFIKDSKRDYPYGDFASYIIGYARKGDSGEIAGEMGIESKYDNKLKGKDGSIIYQKDAYGYQIANTPEIIDKAENGYDIYLTIDSNVQMYLENAIMEFEKAGIEWGTITIADAKTGAIAGSASSPSFDPNVLEITNYNNPLTSYIYEPGSTMKIFSFMAALENGVYNGEEKYPSGNIMVDGYKISDWNTHGWGSITFDVGFTYSSNTAAVRLAQKLGKDKLTDFYEKLGFSQKTGIELPSEYTGKIEMMYDSELASAAFGQGITATPIQNIQALTSLTNNGTVLKPYVISKIVDSNNEKTVYEGKRTELNKVASKETINKVLDLMDLTVNNEDGLATGVKYHTNALTLVGKTGTAQYTNANGEYSSGTYNNIRSFAGVFPKEEPKYIIYLSLKNYLGATGDLAKVTRSVVESIAKYKNIENRTTDTDTSKIIMLDNYVSKKNEEVISKLVLSGLNPIVIGNGDTVIKQYPIKNTKLISGSKIFLLTNGSEYKMPNTIGWTSSEIISLANMMGIAYNINGFGNVASVSIPAGEIIDINNILEITLNNRSVVNEKSKEE